MPESGRRILLALLVAYGLASLIHFTHNAQFLADYPGLPKSWSPALVYVAWIGMTLVGILGWVLLSRGFVGGGLCVLLVYASLGLDSLGHYLLAPLSAHTVAMNSTILAEVIAAGCVFLEAARQLTRRLVSGRKPAAC